MADKPSLYVVERKEVIILVVLFVLVTVLSFTMGVRYGESVGKRTARQQFAAEKEQSQSEEAPSGGSLVDSAEKPKGAETVKVEPAKAEDKHEAQGHSDSHSPEVAAREEEAPIKLRGETKDAVDRSSDEFLLNALKESGIEPPGGKAPGEAKLPQVPKKAKSGTYVIQVGSHPTRGEAENQLRSLRNKKLDPEILPPFKDRQGEWHRVVLSGYRTKREAEKEAQLYKTKGIIVSYFIWRLP